MKTVLDVCCGSKMFWFDKQNPDVLFCDARREKHTLCDGRSLDISPDIIADFRKLPFADCVFKHVVFDPPHLDNCADTSYMAKKYGKLAPEWKADIKAGFAECFRVLEPGGTLVFKWNEVRIKLSEVLALTEQKPLYGHRSGRQAKTHWVAFMKPLK